VLFYFLLILFYALFPRRLVLSFASASTVLYLWMSRPVFIRLLLILIYPVFVFVLVQFARVCSPPSRTYLAGGFPHALSHFSRPFSSSGLSFARSRLRRRLVSSYPISFLL